MVCATASPGCPVYQVLYNTKNVIGQGRDADHICTSYVEFTTLSCGSVLTHIAYIPPQPTSSRMTFCVTALKAHFWEAIADVSINQRLATSPKHA
jgi:hypothetical protein